MTQTKWNLQALKLAFWWASGGTRHVPGLHFLSRHTGYWRTSRESAGRQEVGVRERERETGCRVRPNDPCWCQFVLAQSEITETVTLLDLDPD